jgi:DNA-binding NtrC family response regulator
MLPVLLIVDDEKATRDVLCSALEDDYEVYAAANGKAARAILESEPVDIMLTDLRLGGESGMDLIDYAQTLPQAPACIMMTAYGSPATAAEAKRHGAYYFVTKPLNLDEVELLLKRAAHTRSLEAENRELTATLRPTGGLDSMLGDSPQMQGIFNRIRQVAPTTATVLIEGETGTGKELVARVMKIFSAAAFVRCAGGNNALPAIPINTATAREITTQIIAILLDLESSFSSRIAINRRST